MYIYKFICRLLSLNIFVMYSIGICLSGQCHRENLHCTNIEYIIYFPYDIGECTVTIPIKLLSMLTHNFHVH